MEGNIFLILSVLIVFYAQIQGRSITIENRSSKPVSTGLSYNFNGSLDPLTESFANNLDVSKIATFKSGLLDNEVNYNLDDSRKFKLDACKDDACKNSTAYLVVLDDKICEDTSKELQPVEITITNPVARIKLYRMGFADSDVECSALIVKFNEQRSCGLSDNSEIKQKSSDQGIPRRHFNSSRQISFFITPQESITLNIERIVYDTSYMDSHGHSQKVSPDAPKPKTYDPYVLKDLKPGQKIYLIADDSGIKEDVNFSGIK